MGWCKKNGEKPSIKKTPNLGMHSQGGTEKGGFTVGVPNFRSLGLSTNFRARTPRQRAKDLLRSADVVGSTDRGCGKAGAGRVWKLAANEVANKQKVKLRNAKGKPVREKKSEQQSNQSAGRESNKGR